MNTENKLKQKIYSIPNIYNDINQFICNLEAPKITLNHIYII